MVSFLKKLFSKKELNSESTNTTVHDQDTTINTLNEKIDISGNLVSAIEIKTYNIAEIKKEATQIKNKVGLLPSINFIKDFISTNDIDFKDLLSLLKKVVPVMKKEKSFANHEIEEYISSELSKFKEKDNIENLTEIADILSRINNQYAIEYLKNRLEQSEIENRVNILFFDALILLSDYFFEEKQSEKAFQTLRRATIIVTNFEDKFDYLMKQKIIAEKSANICLNVQKAPNYADYIHYVLVSFILEICRDAVSFPYLSDFFYRKNICFKDGWGFEDNENFENALNYLKITEHKKELLNEIYNFTFNDLPLKIGIPEEYLNEKVLEPLNKLTEDYDKHFPEWKELLEYVDVFKRKPFTEIGLVHEFASEVVKKYYGKNNLL